MNKILASILSLLTLTVCTAAAQDYIHLRSGGQPIAAVVKEVSSETIRYKRYDYQDGPTFTISVKDVAKIVYQNGQAEYYNTPAPQRPRPATASTTAAVPEKQERKKPGKIRFEAHVMGSIPLGNFNGSYSSLYWNDTNEGGAAFGGGFGGKMYLDILPVKGLRVAVNLDFLFNPLNGNAKSIIDDQLVYAYDNGLIRYPLIVDKYPVFANIPITAGLSYQYDFTEKFALAADAAIGLNISCPSTMVFLNTEGSKYLYHENGIDIYSPDREKFKYTPSVQFAWQAGLSAVLLKRFVIGAYIHGTTGHRIKGRNEALVDSGDMEPAVSRFIHQASSIKYYNIQIRLGYLF